MCSGGSHDSMVVLKQETRYARANDNCFSRVTFSTYDLRSDILTANYFLEIGYEVLLICCMSLRNFSFGFQFSLQIEQGIPVLSKWLVFNRFKFAGTKGIKLGPAFVLTR